MKRILCAPAFWGFLFGSVGLFLLFGLALQLPYLQYLYGPASILMQSFGLMEGGFATTPSTMIMFYLISGALYALAFNYLSSFVRSAIKQFKS